MSDHARAGELGVSYTLKELFERVDEKLDRIDAKLDGKADRAAVEALAKDVDELKQWRARVIGIAAGVGAVVGGGAATLVQTFLQ